MKVKETRRTKIKCVYYEDVAVATTTCIQADFTALSHYIYISLRDRLHLVMLHCVCALCVWQPVSEPHSTLGWTSGIDC